MTKTEHSAFVDGIHSSFDIKDWFCNWRALVADRSGPAGDDHRLLPLRETILEALSDSSAEQFLSPLTARHLRRYGRTWSANHPIQRVV